MRCSNWVRFANSALAQLIIVYAIVSIVFRARLLAGAGPLGFLGKISTWTLGTSREYAEKPRLCHLDVTLGLLVATHVYRIDGFN